MGKNFILVTRIWHLIPRNNNKTNDYNIILNADHSYYSKYKFKSDKTFFLSCSIVVPRKNTITHNIFILGRKCFYIFYLLSSQSFRASEFLREFVVEIQYETTPWGNAKMFLCHSFVRARARFFPVTFNIVNILLPSFISSSL